MITASTTIPQLGRRSLLAIPFVAAITLATIAPSDGSPTICGFATCTGIACPGCGMTRAAGHLIRGNLTEALRYHPLILLVVAELLGVWTIWVAHQAGWIRWRHRRWVDVVIGGTAALLVIVWIARLIAGTTPPV
ncbi:MAG: DUF2752 domain-containing protein [Actinomycetota bacterium]|nr:DUF2752 domain-containing protein [Actinomycetota bacterium]